MVEANLSEQYEEAEEGWDEVDGDEWDQEGDAEEDFKDEVKENSDNVKFG